MELSRGPLAGIVVWVHKPMAREDVPPPEFPSKGTLDKAVEVVA